MTAAFGGTALLAAIGVGAALLLWPKRDPDAVPHLHADLPAGHPHLREAHGADGGHDFVIDGLHRHWPKS